MRILIVCGAGASSTFVAQRINRAARVRHLSHTASAASESSLETHIDSVDLVLVGPHLASQLEQIESLGATHGAAVRLLDADVFSDLDGTRTLALIEEATRDRLA
jgi:PTS system cellobiose-specific IIB component